MKLINPVTNLTPVAKFKTGKGEKGWLTETEGRGR